MHSALTLDEKENQFVYSKKENILTVSIVKTFNIMIFAVYNVYHQNTYIDLCNAKRF